jgi:hypothetical protein
MLRLGDPDLAATLLDRGCARAASVCASAAAMYEGGVAVPADATRAAHFRARARAR